MAGGVQLVGIDFLGAVDAAAQFADPFGVDVKAHGSITIPEVDGQRQADIAQADHGDRGVAALQLLQQMIQHDGSGQQL